MVTCGLGNMTSWLEGVRKGQAGEVLEDFPWIHAAWDGHLWMRHKYMS